jgi:hypothetical protein
MNRHVVAGAAHTEQPVLVQVIDMFADLSQVTKKADPVTAAKASLAAALVWAHIGEAKQAASMLARAESFECNNALFVSVLQDTRVALAIQKPSFSADL